MSQTMLVESGIEQQKHRITIERDEFYYRPISALSVVSVFLGLCSLIAMFTVFGLSIALFGAILGTVSFTQIIRARGEIGGKWLAFCGMSLSILFFVSGTVMHTYNYSTEVPDGFNRISFSHDISRKEFVTNNSVPAPHPDVLALDGKQIFLKGYMYPTRQTEGITSFVLVKDTGQCCFGGQPKVWDMIRIVMKDGNSVNYQPGMVSIAGTFHVHGQGTDSSGLTAVYQIDGDYFEKSRFSF